MISKRLGGLWVAIGMAVGLGGCADDYGYGGVNVGYGTAGYYGDPYYDGYGYDGYGYGGAGYGLSNFGWYGDYYYPGTGSYVYDQYRRPFRWNDGQRRYWSDRQRYRGRDWNGQGSWNGFDRRDDGGRQWQGNRGSYGSGQRTWQGNRGARPDGQGYTPRPNGDGRWADRRDDAQGLAGLRGNAGGGWQGRQRGDGGSVSPPVARNPGGWQGQRGGGRGGRSPGGRGRPAD